MEEAGRRARFRASQLVGEKGRATGASTSRRTEQYRKAKVPSVLADLLDVSAKSVRGSMHPYEDRVLVDEKQGLFAVADGVTGSSQGSGAVAAELALELLQEDFAGDVVEAMQEVHRTVYERRMTDRSIGETTLTAAAVKGDLLQLGNLGDSPAYLIRGRTMRSLITADITPLGRITQVVGYPETVNVHTEEAQLRERDVVIVASDGVGHVLYPSFIIPLASESSANRIAERIVEEARLTVTDYDDDKSVIVLRILDS
jgi:serine/threonine protein phosphatase PrpC